MPQQYAAMLLLATLAYKLFPTSAENEKYKRMPKEFLEYHMLKL